MREQGNSLIVSLSLHLFSALYHYRYNLPENGLKMRLDIKKQPVFIVMNGKTIFDEDKWLILPHDHVTDTVRYWNNVIHSVTFCDSFLCFNCALTFF